MNEEKQDAVKMKARSMVSAQLRLWMGDRKMDRFVLAQKSGVHSDSIYKILRGNRGANVDSLALLADGLGIQLAVLLMPLEPDNGIDEE
jgi:transcriptional regulator with XRE-family HTH domain